MRKFRYGQNVRVGFENERGFPTYWAEATYLETDKEREGYHRVDVNGNVRSIRDELVCND